MFLALTKTNNNLVVRSTKTTLKILFFCHLYRRIDFGSFCFHNLFEKQPIKQFLQPILGSQTTSWEPLTYGVRNNGPRFRYTLA